MRLPLAVGAVSYAPSSSRFTLRVLCSDLPPLVRGLALAQSSRLHCTVTQSHNMPVWQHTAAVQHTVLQLDSKIARPLKKKSKKKKKDFSSFGQPTRLMACANHGNEIV